MNDVLLRVVTLIIISSVLIRGKTDIALLNKGAETEEGNEQWSYDYCNITCANKTLHTMCRYPAGGGSTCNNNLKVYLTRTEKEYIEDNMNGLRQHVATGVAGLPMSSNMMKLVWDSELSAIAKRWADQCTQPKHDVCRITSSEEDTGQTVIIGKYQDLAKGEERRLVRIKKNLDVWAQEIKLFNRAWIESYDNSMEDLAGNFTQILWATSIYVGCGYTEFQMKTYVMSRFVCNFRRRGNLVGSSVYRVGKPCSACPSRTNCSDSFPGMCWNGEFGKYDNIPEAGGRARLGSVLVLMTSLVLGMLCNRSLTWPQYV